ncbi:MAG: N-acetyltransferase family protein [Methanomicrobiales archaeon]|nr:N-acetyltransferase family protein [Methanomicrobiales archaeon]
MSAARIRPVRQEDRDAVVCIFNHSVKESQAAFPDQPVEPAFFDVMLNGAHASYVADEGGRVVGCGVLRPLLPFPAFAGTAAVTLFLVPSHVRQGLGSRLMEALTGDARRLGIHTLVAQISSGNRGSISFHARQGFSECGRIPDAGCRFGEPFDLVLMRRSLA